MYSDVAFPPGHATVASEGSKATAGEDNCSAQNMKLPELLRSLSDGERDFISKLDYNRDSDRHRKALDALIERKGAANLDTEIWYPYEVIELSKNILEKDHEREFAACLGIVIANVISGEDNCNDLERLTELYCKYSEALPFELSTMLSDLLTEAQAEQGGAGQPEKRSELIDSSD
jgi:hypothetical protein